MSEDSPRGRVRGPGDLVEAHGEAVTAEAPLETPADAAVVIDVPEGEVIETPEGEEELTTAEALAENGAEITTETETEEARQARLAEEYAAVVTAAETAHAQAVARGEAGFDLSGFTTIAQFFGGQEGGSQGIAGFIDQYYEAGRNLEYQIVDGGLGIGTMLNLLDAGEGGPIQIPREVYESARDMAIAQIVATPDMLMSFIGDGEGLPEDLPPESAADLVEIFGYMQGLQTDQQRQEFQQNLILVLDGNTNIINLNGEHKELSPETILLLQQQVEGIVAPTIAGGIDQLGAQLEGTGILGFLREALAGVMDFAQNLLDGFGVDVNVRSFTNMFG